MTTHTILSPTTEQRVEVQDKAIEACYEDALADSGYMRSIIEQWVKSFPYEEQLDIVTNDHDMWPKLLSFDPIAP